MSSPEQLHGVLPLPEWIQFALANNNDASSSDTAVSISSNGYIRPALSIAASLADLICNLENEERVASSSSSLDEKNDVSPRQPSTDDINLSSENIIVYFGKNHEEKTTIEEVQPENAYLMATHAEFLPMSSSPPSAVMIPKNSSQAGASKETKRIHTLGLIFYELFSGGERPAVNYAVSQKHPPTANAVAQEDLIDPLPISQEATEADQINLSDALNILSDLSEDDDDNNHDNPRKKKSIQQHSSKTIMTISTESLRGNKIPGPLCDLIENMVNSINVGELSSSSSETYHSMSDVQTDLQLMLDQPLIFLRDIDLEELSTNNLHFSETLFGRESEVATLKRVYRQSLSWSSSSSDGNSSSKELVLITGPAGSGKSYLSHQFGNYVKASGGVFLSAKFDQLKQARPLSALAAAFNEYCDTTCTVGGGGDKSFASELRSKLRNDDVFYLTKMIPSLIHILGNENVASDEGGGSDISSVDPQQRLQSLLCQFVEAMTKSSSVPITMYLDDLHFADDASIGVINQLFFTLKSTERIFFIASSRECGALWKMISNLNYFCVPHIQLKLDCMGERAINKTISELLHLSPRITGPLSSIAHHKTQGNALFFSRWMMELSKEGLLRPSLSRRRWEWDEEKIRLRKVPDDVGLFFRDSIHKLSTDVQKSLFIVASFGASLDGALIQPIERALSMQLLIPLNVAVSEGLLDKVGGQFRFSHDCIQEAAYDMMTKEKKYLHHFQLGLYLANDALAEDNDNILFIAVNQLNLGGPKSVEAKDLSFTVADLNLKAGKKCMQMSDFKAAYSFFDHGISFLRKKHWQEHYALSMELFTLAAKCALPNGEFTALNILSEQVLKFARTDDEKLPVMYYSILRLEFASQYAEAAQIIMKVLLQLGVALPESSTSADTLSLVAQTKNKLEKYSIHELKGLKRMEDHGKKMAMLFLARLYHCYFMINPEKKPIVIMKMVQITLSYGMCQTSPLSFVWFGSLLGALGDIEEGHRYTKLAKQLIEENASYESSGEVIGWATQVMCYVEPVQASVGNFIEGIARSMSSGDTNSAFMNMVFYINEGYCSSLYLPILKTKCLEFHQVMKQHNHVNFLSHLIILQRHLQLLMGASWGSDRGFEEEIDVRHPHDVFYAAIYSLMASFIFRRFAPLKDALQQILALGPPDESSLMFGQSEWIYIIGLASYWISRESEEPHWAETGSDMAKGAMGGWTKTSRWNFEHKLFLLEAEEHFCNRNYEQAKNYYEKAIDSAATKKFVKDEALACELAGYFYLEMDEKVTALDYLVKAHERYEMWGATGKATKLHEEMMTKLS